MYLCKKNDSINRIDGRIEAYPRSNGDRLLQARHKVSASKGSLAGVIKSILTT